MRRLFLAALLGLAACGTIAERADQCAKAEQAVTWAKLGLDLACTHQSKACDTAGLVLKAANTAMAAVCPVAAVTRTDGP